ncbi:MAG TPA: HAD-IA family hydrolase [Polyangiaceae bacterium]|nr:HAD-IA family hydrolase [Polyangiaceae bacterium]
MKSSRFTPPSRAYAGYVFDCDGTLAETMVLHHRAWRSALRAAGATFDFDWPLFVSRAGMSLEQTVEELSRQFSVPLDAVHVAQQQRRLYAELESEVVAIPEVLDFARTVAAHGKLAVASGSNRPHVLRTLAAIGASELFSVIVTPEDVPHGKPAPDMFLLAAERLGVAAADCLVLEDAELGVEAARRAGMDWALVGPPASV